MASSSSSNPSLGNFAYVPTIQCNRDQLEILHELQVNFSNLAENDFDFMEDFAGVVGLSTLI